MLFGCYGDIRCYDSSIQYPNGTSYCSKPITDLSNSIYCYFCPIILSISQKKLLKIIIISAHSKIQQICKNNKSTEYN